jgi:hypothetical protein
MLFALGLVIGGGVGIVLTMLVYAASKGSLDGWNSSCTGDCDQGRNCNCVNKS